MALTADELSWFGIVFPIAVRFQSQILQFWNLDVFRIFSELQLFSQAVVIVVSELYHSYKEY